MSEANASDHPDIIWVNEYPNSSGVTHPSRARAEALVGPAGTTAAYQRLPDGVDPETHEQVELWGAWRDGVFLDGGEPSEMICLTGWRPKWQPEPEEPDDDGPTVVVRDTEWTRFQFAKGGRGWKRGHEIDAPHADGDLAYALDRIHELGGSEPKPVPADPPKPYVPEPKEIFEVDGVRYQRRGDDVADSRWVDTWNLDLAVTKSFHIPGIESGDVVCVPIPQVEADE